MRPLVIGILVVLLELGPVRGLGLHLLVQNLEALGQDELLEVLGQLIEAVPEREVLLG